MLVREATLTRWLETSAVPKARAHTARLVIGEGI